MTETAPDHQPNHYFDTFSGQLLTGDVALEIHIEAGGNPADIRKLEEILHDTQHPIPTGFYHNSRDYSLTNEDIELGGQWLANLPREDTQPQMNRFMIQQANRLGIFAGVEQIKGRYNGKLSNFYNAIKLVRARRRLAYSHWRPEDEVAHVIAISHSDKYGTLTEGVEELARHGQGPSRNTLRLRHGSTSAVIEMGGYINHKVTAKMGPEDLIEWGVRFMFDNDGDDLDSHAINYLSPRKLSPSRPPIAKHFGNLPNFRDKVREEYERRVKLRHNENQRKLDELSDDIETGQLPADLFGPNMTTDTHLRIRAQYLIARRLVSHLPQNEIRDIALAAKPERFVRLIQKKNQEIKLGLIESLALALHLYDDLWPFIDSRPSLRIPDGYREAARRQRIAKLHAQKRF